MDLGLVVNMFTSSTQIIYRMRDYCVPKERLLVCWKICFVLLNIVDGNKLPSNKMADTFVQIDR